MDLVIAIDGPSGAGKSTTSKEVARRLGIGYLDTGAMYRAATWWCLHEDVDLDAEAAVAEAVGAMTLSMPLGPDNQQILVEGGEDITAAIRSHEVTSKVSKLSTKPTVREILVARQRAIIADAGRVIAEGRDITTVVAPDADVRVLLTASEQARLERRALESRGGDSAADLAATRGDVLGRDQADSKLVNFTTAADGVVTIDSSALTIAETADAIIGLVPEELR